MQMVHVAMFATRTLLIASNNILTQHPLSQLSEEHVSLGKNSKGKDWMGW